jgi:hypothetical protein
LVAVGLVVWALELLTFAKNKENADPYGYFRVETKLAYGV